MALDINQSGSRNFCSSSVVYRTQFIVSTVKCAKEILAVVIKVCHEKTSSRAIRVRSMQGSSKLSEMGFVQIGSATDTQV